MPQILKTRFRDVPLEEVKDCVISKPEAWETEARGKEVSIILPPVDPSRTIYGSCKGPVYQYADDLNFAACIHMLEIGD